MKRGSQTEDHVAAFIRELLASKKILQIVTGDRFSWLNSALHCDIAVQRLDGTWVPIQVKSSTGAREEFFKKYHDWCLREWGAFLVVVCAPPYGFGEYHEGRKWALYQQIHDWKGRFEYKPWMGEYSSLFDFCKHKRLLPRLGVRVSAFRRAHPEYFFAQ